MKKIISLYIQNPIIQVHDSDSLSIPSYLTEENSCIPIFEHFINLRT